MTSTPRPRPLVGAVVAVALAALLYAMTATSTGDTAAGSGLAVVAIGVGLAAAKHHWARITVTVLLGVQLLYWLPLPLSGEWEFTDNPVVYVLVAALLSVAGVVLLFGPSSNAYFAARRAERAGRVR
ncbi:hypothetical protein [Actinophytocola gossypii]|uniref:Histidine kinase n=1 Tax=Actinophytocola gossypii TaxID=2812003 RepID=A0ABT2J8P5_9PSEU|nr:hypothetical protein [Actinophytocola gossypii]MCT2583939.1 hypothetical protein [Actinophytocola gossypii]